MVARAAREIRDGEVVFVGMRLPLLAFLLARSTHAPGAVGVFETGVLRDSPAEAPLITMSDPPNLQGARMCMGMETVMGLLQAGRVDLGFIGGAEIDRFGNLNTTRVAEGGRPSRAARERRRLRHRLPFPPPRDRDEARAPALRGTGGLRHEPGARRGRGLEGGPGLAGGGPTRVITDKGVFGFDPGTREMVLESAYLGVGGDEVRALTGWDLAVPRELPVTALPMPGELAAIRRFDPEGFWTR